MKLYVCTDHDAHWPVGCASVVVATEEADARALLDRELASHGLKPSIAEPYTLQEIAMDFARAIVLCDGEY